MCSLMRSCLLKVSVPVFPTMIRFGHDYSDCKEVRSDNLRLSLSKHLFSVLVLIHVCPLKKRSALERYHYIFTEQRLLHYVIEGTSKVPVTRVQTKSSDTKRLYLRRFNENTMSVSDTRFNGLEGSIIDVECVPVSYCLNLSLYV